MTGWTVTVLSNTTTALQHSPKLVNLVPQILLNPSQYKMTQFWLIIFLSRNMNKQKSAILKEIQSEEQSQPNT